jgi:hypothetical protein
VRAVFYYSTVLESLIRIVLLVFIIPYLVGRVGKAYPVFFATTLVLALTSVADLGRLTAFGRSAEFAGLYWFNEILRQGFTFLLVISLIYQSLSDHPARKRVRRWLVLCSLVVLALAYSFAGGGSLNEKMTGTLQYLNVTAIVLNLILWFSLVRARKGERLPVLISGGLGLQATGFALGLSLSQFWRISKAFGYLGGYVQAIAGLLCLYVWYRGVRESAAQPAAPPLAAPSEL